MNITKEILIDCFGWDVANWSRAIIFWESFFGSNFLSEKKILELGCGCTNGGLSLWAGLNNAKVVCSDYNFPTATTQEIHKKHQCLDKIDYKSLDALGIPYTQEFDFVFFKSVMGGIVRDRESSLGNRFFSSIKNSLKIGGYVCFAENLYATRFHSFLRSWFGAGRNKWCYIDSGELEDLINSTEGLQIKAKKKVGFLGAFGRNETQRKILGFLDSHLVEKLVPEDYCYIGIYILQRIC